MDDLAFFEPAEESPAGEKEYVEPPWRCDRLQTTAARGPTFPTYFGSLCRPDPLEAPRRVQSPCVEEHGYSGWPMLLRPRVAGDD